MRTKKRKRSMRGIGLRIWILLVLFLAVACAALYLRDDPGSGSVQSDAVLENTAGTAIPVVSSQWNSVAINTLPGYLTEADVTAMEDSVIPIGSDGNLSLTVSLGENTLSAVEWEVRTRDDSRSVGSGTLAGWNADHDKAVLSLDLSSVAANTAKEYRLHLTLTLQNEQKVHYYTRILRADSMHLTEMLDFVLTFHSNLFDKQASIGYASYLENDGSADANTIGEVNIHSSLSQLTYGDLAPEALGGVSIHIQELDTTFGSFYLEYDIKSTDADGTEHIYLADEFFCVQWTETRFYLMNYRRTLSERMDGASVRLADGKLDLGIQKEAVQTSVSESSAYTAFTDGKELWSYRKADHQLTKVFSFLGNETGDGWRRYGIRLLRQEENGNVSFVVWGYMNSGLREGQVGTSCLYYEAETNRLTEKFFAPCTGTYEIAARDAETLASLGADSICYLVANDTLYSIDWESGETVILADQVSRRGLVVNEEQNAAAWKQDISSEQSDSVRILYLDNGETQIVGAPSGDFVTPQGFIGRDCVIGFGHQGDTAVAGGKTITPWYAASVRSENGEEETHYEVEGIYLSSIQVWQGQIGLGRVQASGDTWKELTNDTLICSEAERSSDSGVLNREKDDARMQIYRLTVDAAGLQNGGITVQTAEMPETLSAGGAEEETADGEAVPASLFYYAFAEGRLVLTSPDAGEAIDTVYTKMGAVVDSRGRKIWQRTGRMQNVELAGSERADGASDLHSCLAKILEIQGMSADAMNGVEDSMSPIEAMDALFPGLAVNLTGSPMRALLYYIGQGNPVLLIDRDQNVRLLVGYDLFNVTYYRPGGETLLEKQGQNDATSWLADGVSAIGFLSEY